MHPQQNRHRSVIDLAGFWRFKPDPADKGVDDRWHEGPLRGDVLTIAVPGAWNEQLAERGLMNYVGPAWYETSIEADSRPGRVALYVGAADHHATVWLNGKKVGSHAGGYLPFECDLTEVWAAGARNRITIRVDSRLSMESLPQDVDPTSPLYSGPAYERRHLFPPTRFDFFPYGGLTRSVMIVLTNASFIERARVHAHLNGRLRVIVGTRGGSRLSVRIADADGETAAVGEAVVPHGTCELETQLANVRPWSPANPHLYTAHLTLSDESGAELDRYDQTFGVREIRVENGRMFLNGEPLFLTGFGKHEDYPIVGRGQFRAAYVRDFELMRWVGANSFRTSHYPYDEELIHLADRFGFLVIDEVPAVSLGFPSDDFSALRPLLENHKRTLTELMDRDMNHPSVIAWSTTNEPNLWSEPHYQNEAGRRYFREVFDHVRSIDQTRPVVAVIMGRHAEADIALESCDVIGINRYFGWYTDPAQIETAIVQLDRELEALYARHGKPIIVTEFGADTVEGYHATTAQMFTEEFQQAFIMAYSEVIESKPYCAGAHVWNFADFRTPQHFRRVVLNKKGVFNRNRDPKTAAFALRDRWRRLGRIADAHRPRPLDGSFLVPDVKRPNDREADRDA